ncbi:cytochrome c [Flavobacterium sp. NKUCC04_CG]|nr:cytochrome c [Flavobacterium sp. NKUCC04_CG]
MAIITTRIFFIVLLLTNISLCMSCIEKEEPKQEIYPTIIVGIPGEEPKEKPKELVSSSVAASEKIDLENKGVGPIKTVTLEAINAGLVEKGQEIFKMMCTACHKPEKRFIGPAPKGILLRRSPEWVMNMILNPENMIKDDLLAKELLMEFNGAPMANQNLTEEEARAVLEYFRSL